MTQPAETKYVIPPAVEHLAASLNVTTGMLKETRDFLADTLNRNQKQEKHIATLNVQIAELAKDLAVERRKNAKVSAEVLP